MDYSQYTASQLEAIGAHAVELEGLTASQVHAPAYADGWNSCLQALRGFVWHKERAEARNKLVRDALARAIDECGFRKKGDDSLRPFEEQPEHVQKMVEALMIVSPGEPLPDGCCGYTDSAGRCCTPPSPGGAVNHD